MHEQALNAREFYESRAKTIVKDLREQRQLSYRDLALRLAAIGIRVNERILINRINRGSFSFAFALQLLAAMDAESVSVPRLEPSAPR